MRAILEENADPDGWRLHCKCRVCKDYLGGEHYDDLHYKAIRKPTGEVFVQCRYCLELHPVPDEILRKAGIKESSKLEAGSSKQ